LNCTPIFLQRVVHRKAEPAAAAAAALQLKAAEKIATYIVSKYSVLFFHFQQSMKFIKRYNTTIMQGPLSSTN
jgi:hypothetical protein